MDRFHLLLVIFVIVFLCCCGTHFSHDIVSNGLFESRVVACKEMKMENKDYTFNICSGEITNATAQDYQENYIMIHPLEKCDGRNWKNLRSLGVCDGLFPLKHEGEWYTDFTKVKIKNEFLYDNINLFSGVGVILVMIMIPGIILSNMRD